jgi:sugar O-acyltransferase (sialic acid O-acetyltransferase NeuD family)
LSKPIIIIGGGGHAQVLIEALTILNNEILGATDPKLKIGTKLHHSIPIIGADDAIDAYSAISIGLVNGLGPVFGSSLRESLTQKYLALGYTFQAVIHPTAKIASGTIIDDGAQIMTGAIIQPRSCIGQLAVINTSAIIEHDCRIGANVHIGPGAVVCGGVTIQSECFVGAGAIVLPNILLGTGSTVAAGTTLRRNLKPGEIYYGK